MAIWRAERERERGGKEGEIEGERASSISPHLYMYMYMYIPLFPSSSTWSGLAPCSNSTDNMLEKSPSTAK